MTNKSKELDELYEILRFEMEDGYGALRGYLKKKLDAYYLSKALSLKPETIDMVKMLPPTDIEAPKQYASGFGNAIDEWEAALKKGFKS